MHMHGCATTPSRHQPVAAPRCPWVGEPARAARGCAARLLLDRADKLLQHVAPALVHDDRDRQVAQQVLRVGLQRVQVPATRAAGWVRLRARAAHCLPATGRRRPAVRLCAARAGALVPGERGAGSR